MCGLTPAGGSLKGFLRARGPFWGPNLGVAMGQVCRYCREVITVHLGYFVRHGVRHHGKLELCAGSGEPEVCLSESGCCG